MTRQEALKRLRKMLGPKLGYRVDPSAPSPDEREEARARVAALAEARTQAEAAMQARQRELLQDPEYQRLRAEWQEAKKVADRNAGKLYHFKFTAGVSNGMFFHVRAQGDSWEDVFAKLKKGD
jgi:hypothetical protein